MKYVAPFHLCVPARPNAATIWAHKASHHQRLKREKLRRVWGNYWLTWKFQEDRWASEAQGSISPNLDCHSAAKNYFLSRKLPKFNYQTHIQDFTCHQILLDIHTRRAINLFQHCRTDIVHLQVLHRFRENVSRQVSSATAKINSILKFLLDIKEPVGKSKSNFFLYVIISVGIVPKNFQSVNGRKFSEQISIHLFAALSFCKTFEWKTSKIFTSLDWFTSPIDLMLLVAVVG